MFGYRVPAPDQAMMISGGRRWRGGAPFRAQRPFAIEVVPARLVAGLQPPG